VLLSLLFINIIRLHHSSR